jgi:hypothetical protein
MSSVPWSTASESALQAGIAAGVFTGPWWTVLTGNPTYDGSLVVTAHQVQAVDPDTAAAVAAACSRGLDPGGEHLAGDVVLAILPGEHEPAAWAGKGCSLPATAAMHGQPAAAAACTALLAARIDDAHQANAARTTQPATPAAGAGNPSTGPAARGRHQ